MSEIVINQITGEVIDIPEEPKQELITISQLVEKPVEEIEQIYAIYDMAKQQKEIFEYQLLQEMKKRNIIKVEQDDIRVTVIPEHETERADVEKLKRAGIYDEFKKVSKVKESIRVKIKND